MDTAVAAIEGKLRAFLAAWQQERAQLLATLEQARGDQSGGPGDLALLERNLQAAVQGLGRAEAELLQICGDLAERLRSAAHARELGLSVIRAQEEERRRVAREIHDGPAQLLANVVLRIDVCQKLYQSDPERLREELGQLKDLVRLSLQDVRKVIFDLRPMALDDLGLVPALRAYLKDFQAKTSVETEFDVFGQERRFAGAFEVALFRLVQESLNNVAKHARAARVWVKIDLRGGREIRLVIRDDGVGFQPGAQPERDAQGRVGLLGMRERTELLGGQMELESAPGQGTRLSFVFPLAD